MTAKENKESINSWGVAVYPHPDKQPWPKCCGDKNDKGKNLPGECYCAYRRNNSDGTARLGVHCEKTSFGSPMFSKVEEPFYCCHRMTLDGYHRVCAGWAALQKKA